MLQISKRFRVVVQLLLCIYCTFSHAKQNITIASGNFAPYFSEQGISGEGYFDLVLLKVLSERGYKKLDLIPLNNDAIKRYFVSKTADIAINYTALPPVNSYPSKYRVKFLNRVILHAQHWTKKVESLHDLNNLTIGSFIGASDLFGNEYRKLTQLESVKYIEIGNQQALNKQLHKNKIDVRVGDYLVFYWHTAHLTALDPNDYIYLDLLDYQGSFILFHDKDLRDKFDQGLKLLIRSGELKAITTNWLLQYKLPILIKQPLFSLEKPHQKEK